MSFGLLCPGQSAQRPETLAGFLSHAPRALQQALAGSLGMPLARLAADTMGLLHENRIAQPLLCAVQVAAFRELEADLPPIAVAAGYSIGELAAYGCAGALADADLLRLARLRAEYMDAATCKPAAMIAVRGLSRAPLEAMTRGGRAFIAIANGADRFVIAGEAEATGSLAAAVQAQGASVTSLAVRVASHTPLMASVVEKFRAALTSTAFRAPSFPVLAGISGDPVGSRDRAIETLSAQVAQTVEWQACMIGLQEEGCRACLELPPGADLAKLTRDSTGIAARGVDEFRTRDGARDWAARQLAR